MQALKIGGETYTVQIGFAAANLLQELTDQPLIPIIQHMAGAGTRYLAPTLYASMRLHHGSVTLDQCGKLLETACEEGQLANVIKAMTEELGRMLNPTGAKAAEPQKKATGSARKGA